MKVRDTFRDTMRGQVWGEWRNQAGQAIGKPLRFNMLSYGCADILAGLASGNILWRPTHIGFIYGDQASPVLDTITRTQDWTTLTAQIAAINSGNIQVSPFTLPPVISIDTDGGTRDNGYTGNSVTYASITKSGAGGSDQYPLGVAAPYAPALADGHYLYQAVLLSKVNNVLVPMARVTLDDGYGYSAKPAGYELALFWQVSFF